MGRIALISSNHRSAIIMLMLQVTGSGFDSQVVVNFCISSFLRLCHHANSTEISITLKSTWKVHNPHACMGA